jgi:hypothetical protein
MLLLQIYRSKGRGLYGMKNEGIVEQSLTGMYDLRSCKDCTDQLNVGDSRMAGRTSIAVY